MFRTWTNSNFTSCEVWFTECNLPISITRVDHRFRNSSKGVTNFGRWKIGLRTELKSHLSPNNYPLYTSPARLSQEPVVPQSAKWLVRSAQSDINSSAFNNTEIRAIQHLSKEYEDFACNVNTARASNWLFTFIYCQSRECIVFYHYSPYFIMM